MGNSDNTTNYGHNLIKRILGFSMASWINCLISFISTPIVTRLFVPAELGKVNMFNSYANILIPIVCLGFDQAYMRFCKNKEDGYNEESLLKTVILFSTIVFIPVALVVLVWFRYFSESIIGYASISVCIALLVYVCTYTIYRYVNVYARMKNNILAFTIQSVIFTLFIKLSYAITAFFSATAEPAILTITCSTFVFISIVFILFIAGIKRNYLYVNKQLTIDLIRFAFPMFVANIIVSINTSLSTIILKQYTSFENVGIFSNASTIAQIITFIQAGINTFWMPFVYENYEKEQTKIQTMHKIISLLMIGFALVIMIFKDLIYFILVDKSYYLGISIFPLLLISPICATISETLGLGIEISKKTYWKILAYFVGLATNIALCYILIPRFNILGCAIASAISAIVTLFLRAFIGEKFYRCSTSYTKLIISMAILLFAITINYFDLGMIDTLTTIVALLIVMIIYRNEIKTMLDYLIIF